MIEVHTPRMAHRRVCCVCLVNVGDNKWACTETCAAKYEVMLRWATKRPHMEWGKFSGWDAPFDTHLSLWRADASA